jgi:aspartyl-tRNA synthetase
MYRSHTCGELRVSQIGETVTLAGWVAKSRVMGSSMAFVDIRDRYGITQLAFNEAYSKELLEKASTLGREFVIQATGTVIERSNKNTQIPTGEIEIKVTAFSILNSSI